MSTKLALMFQHYPKTLSTFKVLSNIFIGVVSFIFAILLAKRLIEPLILSFFELEEIELYALSGLVNLVTIVFAYIAFVMLYEKRRVVELSFAGPNMFYGTVFGILIISITSISLFTAGYYEVVSHQEMDEMFLVLIALTSQAITGEILFRGILFRIIEGKIGTVYSLVLVSVSLGLLNILVDGPNLLVLISTMLISLLWCSIYVLSRNLWVVGMSYAAWLYTIFVTGILDEHWRASSPIVSSYNGPDFITGGEFGPEHSIITAVLVSICILWILKVARNRGLFIKAF